MHTLRPIVALLLFASAQIGIAGQPGTEIKVWTARAIATVLAEVGPEFERGSGYRLKVTSDLPPAFARRVSAGEHFMS